MKTETFWKWMVGLALAVLPLPGGCDQEAANPALAGALNTNPTPVLATSALTNAMAAEAVEQQLEDAPGQVVSKAAAPPPSVALSGPATEIAKLAQAGLEESVMLSFVTNSPSTFNLSSDAIIYLSDIGVPGSVVTAMIRHDQSIKESSANYSGSPVYTNQNLAASGTPTPYPPADASSGTAEAEPAPVEVVQVEQPPAAEANVTYTYFYDSLAPYGSWIQVAGYGMCWQPTVVVVNRGWRPYCDRGRWVYTDCGWYWSSEYSWGWGPFHYGRWFNHSRWGWCWAPDTVWGPSWVSWRYSQSHCGWAPLPPTACFTPGIGFAHSRRHGGSHHPFGLSESAYTVVPLDRFSGKDWYRHRVPAPHARGFFDHSTVANRIFEHKGTVMNPGIPLSRVEAAGHRQVPRMRIHEAASPGSARFMYAGNDNRALGVYRPHLPQPTRPTPLVGQGVRPEHGLVGDRPIPPGGRSQAIGEGRNRPGSGSVNSTSNRGVTAPITRNRPAIVAQSQPRPGYSIQGSGNPRIAERTAPLVLRGPDRSNSSTPERQPLRRVATPPMLNQNPGPVAPGRQPGLLARNDSTLNLRGPSQPAIRAESPPPARVQAGPQNPAVFRQQTRNFVAQSQRASPQPAAVVPGRPSVSAPRSAPAAPVRVQQGGAARIQSSGQPSRPAQVQSAPAATVARPAPAAPAAPSTQRSYNAPQPSRSSGQDSSARGNR